MKVLLFLAAVLLISCQYTFAQEEGHKFNLKCVEGLAIASSAVVSLIKDSKTKDQIALMKDGGNFWNGCQKIYMNCPKNLGFKFPPNTEKYAHYNCSQILEVLEASSEALTANVDSVEGQISAVIKALEIVPVMIGACYQNLGSQDQPSPIPNNDL